MYGVHVAVSYGKALLDSQSGLGTNHRKDYTKKTNTFPVSYYVTGQDPGSVSNSNPDHVNT